MCFIYMLLKICWPLAYTIFIPEHMQYIHITMHNTHM